MILRSEKVLLFDKLSIRKNKPNTYIWIMFQKFNKISLNFFILIVLLAHFPIFAGSQSTNRPDSLFNLLRHAPNDSLRFTYLCKIANFYLKSNPDSAKYYANRCLHEAEKKDMVRFVARAYTLLGIEMSNKGEYEKALEFYLKSLKINEQLKDETAIAGNNNNIGLAFLDMGNFTLALEYYNKALQIHLKNEAKQEIADMYNNIGIIYCSKGSLDTCLDYQLKSVALKKEVGDKNGLATSYDNIGLIYLNKGKKDDAIAYFFESKNLKEELNDKFGLCITYLNISQAYTIENDLKNATEFALKELELAKQLNSKTYKRYGYENLANVSYKAKDYKTAYDYFRLYSSIKDSILNEDNAKSMQELQTSYESVKKDNEISLLNKDNLVKEADLKKQQILNWSIGAGLLIVLVSSAFVFRSYRQKKKGNVLLEEKNIAINEQNQIISEKKKEIEDSINYARYIQESILPDTALFKNYFQESLLLFMPKDIVSGDFYFLHPSSDGSTIWLAAVDCTGHGVPGGFMSVIGAEVFTQGVQNEKRSPANVLAHVNKKIKQFLKQDSLRSNSKDGMDAALCAISADKKELLYQAPIVLYS